MTDKEKILSYIDKLLEKYPKNYYLLTVAEFIDSLQEESVNNPTLLCRLSDSVGIEEAVKETEEYKEWQGDPERQQSFIDFAKFGANYKHHTSKDLEEKLKDYAYQVAYDLSNDWLKENATWDDVETAVKLGAQWQKEHILKDAQGDDLPEIDKEVIVLIEVYGHYRVIFAHRVDENAEFSTSIGGKPFVLHPKRYDKGCWNVPGVKWWLDLDLPKIT